MVAIVDRLLNTHPELMDPKVTQERRADPRDPLSARRAKEKRDQSGILDEDARCSFPSSFSNTSTVLYPYTYFLFSNHAFTGCADGANPHKRWMMHTTEPVFFTVRTVAIVLVHIYPRISSPGSTCTFNSSQLFMRA